MFAAVKNNPATRQYEDALKVVAKWMSENKKLKIVHVRDGQPRADCEKGILYIPPMKDLSAIELMKVRAFYYHESLHVLHTSIKAKPEGTLGSILNSLEDFRIEALGSQSLDGCREAFAWAGRYFAADIGKHVAMGEVKKPLWEALCAMSFALRGIPSWQLTPKAQKYYDAAFETYSEIRDARSTEDALEIAKRILKLVDEVKENEQKQNEQKQNEQKQDKQDKQDKNQKSDKSEESEEKSEPQDGDSEEDGESEGEEKSEGESEGEGEGEEKSEGESEGEGEGEEKSEGESEEEGESEDGKSEGEGEDNQDGEAEGDADAEGEGESESEAEGAAGEGEGEGEEQGEEGDDTTDGEINPGDGKYEGEDKEEQIGNGTAANKEEREEELAEEADGKTLAELLAKELAEKVAEIDPNDYTSVTDNDETRIHEITQSTRDAFKDEYKAVENGVKSLAHGLEQALRIMSRSRKQDRMPRGKLDMRRLTHLITGTSKDVFYRTENGMSLDVAVSIVIDESGSMGHGKDEAVRQMSIALGECLDQLHIPFEIVGATTKYFNREANKPELDGFSRTNPIITDVFKGFGENWKNVAPRIVNVTNYKHYADGEVVLNAANRLKARREKRKIVFSLSDGEPAAGHDNDRLMGKYLIEVCEKARKSGVEVYSVSILSDAPVQYYGKKYSIVVESVDKIGSATINKFAEVISGGRL